MVDWAGWLARQRARHAWLDHVLRANESYNARHGNYYAAAITYFSVLSIMPILMVGTAIAGAVLAGNHDLFERLQNSIVQAMPGELGSTVGQMLTAAVDARNTIGIIGLVIAAYAGLGWMSSLRDALTVQWDRALTKKPIWRKWPVDLLSLIGLGIAIVLSFAVTSAGTLVGSVLLRLAGLGHSVGAGILWEALTIILGVAANWLVFLWVLVRLPRERVAMRGAARGALIAAIGFEILKQLASLLLRGATSSPTAAVFGSIIGLLVFANLVSRLVLLTAAWTATGAGAGGVPVSGKQIPAPAPAVIRPVVWRRNGVGPVGATGLLAVGTLLGFVLRRRS
ncbi:MAG TPA: inner membrane protein YhjD [Pseudonocardiaceae bacterium]